MLPDGCLQALAIGVGIGWKGLKYRVILSFLQKFRHCDELWEGCGQREEAIS